MKLCMTILSFVALAGAASLAGADSPTAPDGWTTSAPRDEIKPQFACKLTGGIDGQAVFSIRTDARD